MSDLPPPSMPPPEHPAPPSNWKPLSGLAVTAFVLSLLLMLVALPFYFIAEALPLALGILTLVLVKPGQKRGRILAVWAIVIAIAAGSCGYRNQQLMRQLLGGTSESILSVLSSQSSEEEKTKSLRSWAWPKALEEDEELPKKWLTRYQGVVEKFGAWKETFDEPSVLEGPTYLLVPPEGLIEVGTKDQRPPAWTTLSAIWTHAVFEKGIVYVAIVLQGGDQKGAEAMTELRPGEEAAVIGDVRFYHKKP